MKGSKCKCGFATNSVKTRCPRCGKEMKDYEWKNRGKILSFVELQVVPQGFESPYNMALVWIDDDGPKVICWTTDSLKVDEEVVLIEYNGKYLCSPGPEAKNQTSEPD
ncbi:MAG TPA: hypothetical protein VJ489_04350 [Thermoplasmata archaeon]|nr:hypothetical protein [Thermoplasmata archaeon]